jgi:hypothetical protein
MTQSAKKTPIHDEPGTAVASGPHETDFYTWTVEQAALLRARKFAEIDAEHIAEELEALGGSQKSALESHYRLVLHHLLKWVYQKPLRTPSWRLTISNSRSEIAILLRHSPGLKGQRDALFEEAYRLARRAAAGETGLPMKIFPEECPWTRVQAEDLEFFPD